MTLKVTNNQYGHLSWRQLGFLLLTVRCVFGCAARQRCPNRRRVVSIVH